LDGAVFLLAAIDPSRSSIAGKEDVLSKSHGDTARFHRLRKKKIANRQKARELRVTLTAAANAAKRLATEVGSAKVLQAA
jgi:hypothetical protein